MIFLPSFATAASLPDAAPLLPESLAARSEMAINQKTHTVFLEEDDPEKLTELINLTNNEYAQKGWSVFAINSYLHNGDLDGVFITYQKGLAAK
jgi:hypothetical protein